MATSTARVYIETGKKKVWATAVDWPGWSRAGKNEAEALEAFVEYAERYRTTIGTASRGMPRPTSLDDLEIVDRVKGNATTDFGAPAMGLPSDDEDLEPKKVARLVRVLQASWEAFDAIADDAAGVSLRKGPRGGGRDVDSIISHVIDADGGYLPRVGGQYRAPAGADRAAVAAGRRAAAIQAIEVRARGEDPPKPPRTNLWSVEYFIRRSAWHALDHAWEIQDKRED